MSAAEIMPYGLLLMNVDIHQAVGKYEWSLSPANQSTHCILKEICRMVGGVLSVCVRACTFMFGANLTTLITLITFVFRPKFAMKLKQKIFSARPENVS